MRFIEPAMQRLHPHDHRNVEARSAGVSVRRAIRSRRHATRSWAH